MYEVKKDEFIYLFALEVSSAVLEPVFITSDVLVNFT
jgi:hypothetical protein